MKRLTILAILLSGCGQAPIGVVDPLMAPYFARFSQAIGVDVSEISGRFANLSGATVGLCTVSGQGKLIQIDPTNWDKAGDDEREEILFHELGHCSMNLVHIPELQLMNSYLCPVSIMYPYDFGKTNCYKNNKPYYYAELRSHK